MAVTTRFGLDGPRQMGRSSRGLAPPGTGAHSNRVACMVPAMTSASPPFLRLSERQRALLERWMPRAELVRDLSWNLVDTVVLHVRNADRDAALGGAAIGDAIVKAAGPANHHIGRELDAHQGFTEVWCAAGQAARLRAADRDARIFLLDYLPGELAERSAANLDPRVHRQAGEILRRFHAQASRPDDGSNAAAVARALKWLDGVHRIAPAEEQRLRALLARPLASAPPLVPTHGDWQPRNWLVDGAELRVIDLGRFAFRAAATDLTRLSAQQWRQEPACEAAFFDGYGADPREPSHWLLARACEAIGTAVWAHQVGDEPFERQGHRMIANVLAEGDA